MTTLLSPSEIKNYTGVDLRINPCNFRDIYNIEYAEARQRLGLEFYEDLTNALADYSAEPEYVAATTYAIDDVVKYQGIYYKALVENTGITPTVAGRWEVADKFTGACAAVYNELWCNYLAPYLSNLVLAQRLPYIWTQIKDIGVTETDDNTDGKKYDRLQAAINRDKERAWNNLSYYLALEENADNTCFANFKTNCENGQSLPISTSGYRPGQYRFG